MDAALDIRRVTKRFGATCAVDELDLVVPRGATYGVIGPSGAGKTTAIRMITGALGPEARERLRVLVLAEGGDGQNLGGSHHPLPAASVNADLEHV